MNILIAALLKEINPTLFKNINLGKEKMVYPFQQVEITWPYGGKETFLLPFRENYFNYTGDAFKEDSLLTETIVHVSFVVQVNLSQALKVHRLQNVCVRSSHSDLNLDNLFKDSIK